MKALALGFLLLFLLAAGLWAAAIGIMLLGGWLTNRNGS